VGIATSLPIALTIAGSDSGGGAGIQADLKTFHAFRVFGTSVVTAVTAQNTRGVDAIHPIPLDVVRAQIDAVVVDLRPAALKSGMLATAGLVSTVAVAIRDHALERYVLDPVMVATSGDRLLEAEAVAKIVEELVPLAELVTPNIPEAEILSDRTIDSVDDMQDAGRDILDLGAGAVLVKGGHLEGDVVDVLITADEELVWTRPRIATRHTHGTGCTLSAAITAALALGDPLPAAVERGIRFIQRAIADAPGLGSGHGPVSHFVDTE